MDGAILSAWSSYTSHAEALAAAVAQQKAARQVGVLLVHSCCPALPCRALPELCSRCCKAAARRARVLCLCWQVVHAC